MTQLTFWDNKKLSIPFGLLSRFLTRLTTYRNKVTYLF